MLYVVVAEREDLGERVEEVDDDAERGDDEAPADLGEGDDKIR